MNEWVNAREMYMGGHSERNIEENVLWNINENKPQMGRRKETGEGQEKCTEMVYGIGSVGKKA